MGNAQKPTRALLAYCALAERLARPQASPVSALIPFFGQICAARTGELFDAQVFATDVTAKYGLRIPKLAALALTEALEAEGYLEAITPGSRGTPYRYTRKANGAEAETEAVSESKIDALLARFVQSCRIDEALAEVPEADLQDGFLTRLVNADSMRILSRREGSSEIKRTVRTLSVPSVNGSLDPQARIELHLDFAVSEFLLALAANDTTAFEIASDVAFASMAAEAIACFQEPSSARSLSDLTVVLDSPLLLDMLGVNEEYGEYGRELLSVLRTSGAQIVAFDHSVNEAEAAVHAQLEYLRSGVNRAGNAVSTTAKPDLLAALHGSVAQRCENRLGISIVRDPDGHLHKRQVAAVGNIQSLMDERMRGWGHQEARDYDQKTIWSFLTLRDSASAIQRICDARWLFVSRNTALVAIANDAWKQWLRDVTRHSEAKIAAWPPLALSDKQFAGYAWLRTGGKDGSIPTKRLLAHCSAAVRPRADIKARAYNLFLSVHGKEQAEDLIVLMEDREGSRALMRATHGDPLDVTTERLPFIIEQVKLAAGEFAALKARAEAEEELTRVQNEHEGKLSDLATELSAAREALSEERRQAALRAVQASEDQSAMDLRLEALKSNLGEMQRAADQRTREIARRSFLSALRQYRSCRWLIVVVFTLVALVTTQLSSDSPTLSAILSTAVFFLSFWFVPNYLDGIPKFVARRDLRARLTEQGLAADELMTSIDWADGTWPFCGGATEVVQVRESDENRTNPA